MSEQKALHIALSEHFEAAAAPQAAVVGGDSVMGFPALSDATIGGALALIKAWMLNASKAGLLPSKEDVLKMVDDAFDKYIAPHKPFAGHPFVTQLAKAGLAALVSAAYDAID